MVDKIGFSTLDFEDFFKSLDEKIITVTEEPQKLFRTNYTDNSKTYDSEVNSGDYIVDDSQYIDFKKLLQRSANCSKEAIDYLASIPVVDNVGGVDEPDFSSSETKPDLENSVDKSTDLSIGEAGTPQECPEASNPVDKLPDASAQAEANGQ